MDLSGSALFYYEAYEREIDSDDWVFGHWIWRPLSPVPSAGMATNVSPPTLPLVGEVLGFDVEPAGSLFNGILDRAARDFNPGTRPRRGKTLFPIMAFRSFAALPVS